MRTNIFTYSGNRATDQALKGLSFLSYRDIPDFYEFQKDWKSFWPQTGNPPIWDAVGWLETDSGNYVSRELLLVEAKAHLDEIKSSCNDNSPGSIDQICNSFNIVKAELGISLQIDWLSHYYQYANHITMLWFLLKHNISARLVQIYFIGDNNPSANCLFDQPEWEEAITLQNETLALPDDYLICKRIHHVYIPLIQEYKLIEIINKRPVNQIARNYLKAAGADLNSSILYVFQLVLWALDKGFIVIKDRNTPSIPGFRPNDIAATGNFKELVEKLAFETPPLKAMHFLCHSGPDSWEFFFDETDFEQQETPEDAAIYVIECLLNALD
jgi:hypothetical protein